MEPLPLVARLYVAGVMALGAALAAFGASRAPFDEPILFAVLLALAAWTSTMKVALPLWPFDRDRGPAEQSQSGSSLSVSYAIDVASLLLLGPHEAMIIAAAGAWCQCTIRRPERNPLCRTLFSMACAIVTVQGAGLAYTLAGGHPATFSVAAMARPLVALAATYFVINTIAVATAVGLSTRVSIVEVWRGMFLWTAPSYFVGALAAALVAGFTEQSGHWVTPLSVGPLYLTYRTYRVYTGRIENEQRHLQQVSDLHLATVEALARAVDAKVDTSHSHIRRVQAFSVALAKAWGITNHAEMQAIRTAALLHDIGKIAVPEHILSKPGPLTEEEFDKIRTHPDVGADIVASLPFPYPVAPLIRCHHERWDGKGYPSRLKGDEIPLGARILAIADAFEALMAERSYHKAMTWQEAVAALEAAAGNAFDPKLVETFVGLLPDLLTSCEAAAPAASVAAPTSAAGETRLAPAPEAKVFHDIALAHREIYALYEIAQSMGTSLAVSDTMTLIASKLSNLVPFSACALFLYDPEQQWLRCRHAVGTDADQFFQIEGDIDAAVLRRVSPDLNSMLISPLIVNERHIGTLGVFHVQPSFYRDDHRRLLERVCEQAAAVIHNAIVFEQTQEDSLTDPLTGLPNTRFLSRHVATELARAADQQGEVALMVMDLDHFKAINDNHGHNVGDRALCEVARALQAAIRPYDVCVRYAGDEFIVVLADCGGAEAEHRRAMLQEAIDGIVFEGRPGKRLRLAISVGMATFPADGRSYETLLAVADSRMYRDKPGERAPV